MSPYLLSLAFPCPFEQQVHPSSGQLCKNYIVHLNYISIKLEEIKVSLFPKIASLCPSRCFFTYLGMKCEIDKPHFLHYELFFCLAPGSKFMKLKLRICIFVVKNLYQCGKATTHENKLLAFFPNYV